MLAVNFSVICKSHQYRGCPGCVGVSQDFLQQGIFYHSFFSKYSILYYGVMNAGNNPSAQDLANVDISAWWKMK
jgi:hypothetical protein